MLKCAALCRSVVQRSVPHNKSLKEISVAVCCSVWQCVAVCCSVLQSAAMCCSVLQCARSCVCICTHSYSVLQCVAMCCSVLQCVAVFCSVLQCAVGIFYSVLQRIVVPHNSSARCPNTHKIHAVPHNSQVIDPRLLSPYIFRLSDMPIPPAGTRCWFPTFNIEPHSKYDLDYSATA